MNHSNFTSQEIEQIKKRTQKPCTICQVVKDLNQFGKKPTAIDGRTPGCLQCQRKQQSIIRMGRKVINFS